MPSMESNIQAGIGDKVVKTIDHILRKAVTFKASDIHIEPCKEYVMIRFRIDGQMVEIGKIESSFLPNIIARIKVTSGMDISERRVPQDGRMSMEINDILYNFRVATLPSMHGENIVLRILDQSAINRTIGDLGFPKDILESFSKSFHRSNGIVFVTGPTGSGKTTTLYAILNELNDGLKNIISIENPIEYELNGITQSQVDYATGLTFEKGIKAMLRLDPDILMVGEIRDKETAKVATESAMTGHLVLSTLHTNESTSAPERLTEMGIEPFLIANSMRSVLSQRLVRKLCPFCTETYKAPKELRERILSYKPKFLMESNNISSDYVWETIQSQELEFYRSHGCDSCNDLGYKGRFPVYELMVVDEEIAAEIVRRESSQELRQLAYKKGMRTLLEDGLKLALGGQTSVEEIFRVIT